MHLNRIISTFDVGLIGSTLFRELPFFVDLIIDEKDVTHLGVCRIGVLSRILLLEYGVEDLLKLSEILFAVLTLYSMLQINKIILISKFRYACKTNKILKIFRK